MSGRLAGWKRAVYAYTCPTCGAAPDEACRTRTGNHKPDPHADRGRLGHRCWKCGIRLPDTAEAGDLCGRCRLVEDLLIERYSRRPR